MSLLLFCMASWGQTLELAQAAQAASAMAEVARSKDIVWLALMTAIVSMGISLFKDWYIGRSISRLSETLAKRPCIYAPKHGHEGP
jgi:hypothetical protein